MTLLRYKFVEALYQFGQFWFGFKLPQWWKYNLSWIGLCKRSFTGTRPYTFAEFWHYNLSVFGFKVRKEACDFYMMPYAFPIFEWYRRWLFCWRDVGRRRSSEHYSDYYTKMGLRWKSQWTR